MLDRVKNHRNCLKGDELGLGTAERFFRPCGTLFSWNRAVPSAEALGYFLGILHFTLAVSSNR